MNDERNKPPPIPLSHIKRGRLALSSAEALAFTRHLTVIIGDFIPENENDDVWKLVVLIKKILNILTATCIQKSACYYLKTLVEEYLFLFSQLFPRKLRPKHHFLTHYWRILLELGPLWNINTMR